MSFMTGLALHGTLLDGTAVVVKLEGSRIPLTVWTVPVAGDTVTISYSLDNGVSYNTWPAGGVTSFTKDSLLSGATHLKIQRTAGAGVTSTWGTC